MSAIEWLQCNHNNRRGFPCTPLLRIWAQATFSGRSGIVHDSAGREDAQIINPLGHGTAPDGAPGLVGSDGLPETGHTLIVWNGNRSLSDALPVKFLEML
jgi:hypothetical protein